MLNKEDLIEINEHLKQIGTIMLPLITHMSNENGVILRNSLNGHRYGNLIESFLDMVSSINPQIGIDHKLKLIPKE